MKHIVLWNFLPEMTEEEKSNAGQIIKDNLTGLRGKIDGLLSIEVYINEFESSNRDIALFTEFRDNDALQAYQVNPEHVKATTFVRSVTCERICFDFME